MLGRYASNGSRDGGGRSSPPSDPPRVCLAALCWAFPHHVRVVDMSCATQHGVVELHRVTKRYGDELPAVSELTLRVRQGELLALLGPSGCGKTTTLRLIAGLLRPSGGRITLDGVDITDWPSHRRDMGVVFQSYALFPHLN